MRLIVDDLACERGGRLVFSALNFRVEAGETIALAGRNGVGKSSLLRVIAGLVRAVSGKIRLDGGAPEASVGEQAHYCGHLDAFKPSLTVAENLAFWTAWLGGDGSAPSDALGRLGLDHAANLPAGYLSAGQRRRLALARLLTVRRPLWLLDEPYAALDVGSQALVASLIADHAAAGGLVIAATHQPLGVTARDIRLG